MKSKSLICCCGRRWTKIPNKVLLRDPLIKAMDWAQMKEITIDNCHRSSYSDIQRAKKTQSMSQSIALKTNIQLKRECLGENSTISKVYGFRPYPMYLIQDQWPHAWRLQPYLQLHVQLPSRSVHFGSTLVRKIFNLLLSESSLSRKCPQRQRFERFADDGLMEAADILPP